MPLEAVALPIIGGAMLSIEGSVGQLHIRWSGGSIHVLTDAVLTTSQGQDLATWTPESTKEMAQEFGSRMPRNVGMVRVLGNGQVVVGFKNETTLTITSDGGHYEQWRIDTSTWSIWCDPSDPRLFDGVGIVGIKLPDPEDQPAPPPVTPSRGRYNLPLAETDVGRSLDQAPLPGPIQQREHQEHPEG
jgi:hypothetical protein